MDARGNRRSLGLGTGVRCGKVSRSIVQRQLAHAPDLKNEV